MNPQYERFNKRFEQSIKGNGPGAEDTSDVGALAGQKPEEAENADLLALARQLRATPYLHADPAFAAQLERRVLRHALTRPQTARGWSLAHFWSQRRALALSMSLLLVLVLLGMGALAFAARIIYPAGPFSGPGHVQSAPTISPADLATADLQTARLRLLALQNVANAAQADAYVQDLASFDTQLARATGSISALPAGGEKTLLSTQLAQLKGDARQKLRGWLRGLTPTASAATTSELGRLGETVPQVNSASIVLPAHPRGSATVRVTGSGFQPGVRLLVDGKLIPSTGALQNGQLVFVLTWSSEKRPHTLGIVNPDGTAAQTDNVAVTIASKMVIMETVRANE